MLSFNDYIKAGETTVSNLVLENYAKIGMTDEEFLFWLQLYRLQRQGNSFPDLSELTEIMGKELNEEYRLLHQLVSKQMIRIETKKNEQGQVMDTYDLMPVFEKIAGIEEQKKAEKTEISEELAVKQLYQSFEKEFSRPLSPIELEMVGQWLKEDQYSVELIRLALREAVLNQAYSLKYIDRILLAWERKNITTKEQVAQDQHRRKQMLQQKEIDEQLYQEEQQVPHVTLHNWLNPEDGE